MAPFLFLRLFLLLLGLLSRCGRRVDDNGAHDHDDAIRRRSEAVAASEDCPFGLFFYYFLLRKFSRVMASVFFPSDFSLFFGEKKTRGGKTPQAPCVSSVAVLESE